MPSSDLQPKVLIVGAGIGGLALAQILRKQGVPFEIFERDDGSRSQGWNVALDKCLDNLKPQLPDDLDELENASPNYPLGKSDSFAFVNNLTHEIIGVAGDPAKGDPPVISANRDALRRILTEHLNVRYCKQFARYVEDADGVTVHFKDGSTARGTVLVGADGANSRIRAQLLNGFEATPSNYMSLHGNVVLSPSEYEAILRDSNSGVLFGEPGMKSYVLLIDYLEDDLALFNWILAWQSQDPKSEHAWAQSASAESLHCRALEKTKHSPAYFRQAIEKTGPKGMHTPPITLTETVLPVDVLPTGRVTLLGDSAHSMVPFRGMGANMALLDASDLGPLLTGVIKDGRSPSEDFRSYESVMIPRGRTRVLDSRADGESPDSTDVSGGRLSEQRQKLAGNGEGQATQET